MTSAQPQPIRAPELQRWLKDAEATLPRLVDVREDQELALASLPGDVLHLPLSRSQEWIGDLQQQLSPDQPLVVVCHAGVRSHHFGLWLLEQNPTWDVWNLEGGIDAWSVEVDPSVPRY